MTLMSQFYMQKFDDEDLSGCLASQTRPVTTKVVERNVPAKQKFDDEDLSGCLVQSGFLRPNKAMEVIRQYPLSGNLEVDRIEYDEDTGSDWLYQH